MALCSIIYMRDKTQDIRYFVLTLFAIIKELEKASALSPSLTAELAAGLPPEHDSVLKDRFAAYFKRGKPVRFSYKGRPILFLLRLPTSAVTKNWQLRFWIKAVVRHEKGQ